MEGSCDSALEPTNIFGSAIHHIFVFVFVFEMKTYSIHLFHKGLVHDPDGKPFSS
jgi:hypothetical protein